MTAPVTTSSFAETLAAFCQNQMPLSGLIAAMERLLAAQPGLWLDMQRQLDDALQHNQLSAASHIELTRYFARYDNADDDTTRFVDLRKVKPNVVATSFAPAEQAVHPGHQATASIEPDALTVLQRTNDDSATLFTPSPQTPTAAHTAHAMPWAEELPAPPLAIGSVLKERFVLKDILGHGGMGVVYKALDLRKQEAQDKSPYVALKVLNTDFQNNPTAFIALQRETRKAQTLAHPNIITVYDFDRDHSHIFMSMEILNGKSLSEFIAETAPNGLPFKKAWPMIRSMCQALAYAHKHEIIHSDFKPGNVAVLHNGDIKVLDFGIACAMSHQDNEHEETVFNPRRDLGGLTPAYASLEMFQANDPAPSDDVYALACVCYELLSGKHPFGKLSAPKAYELGLRPKPIPDLGRRQWRALQKALAFESKNRTPDVATFMEAMRPKSPLPLVLGSLLAVGMGVVVFGYFRLAQEADPLQDKITVLTPEQTLKIRDLLDLAAMHTEVGFLTAPTGSNAAWAYRQILEIDPYSKEAKEGLKTIADKVEQQAEDLYQQGNLPQSLAKVEEGLEVMPKHEGLSALKQKIQQP